MVQKFSLLLGKTNNDARETSKLPSESELGKTGRARVKERLLSRLDEARAEWDRSQFS